MRLSRYTFTREDADRITRVLSRQGGASTLRDLHRRHRIWSRAVDAAERAGIVAIETRRPRIGRPSRIARLTLDVGNIYPPAEFPTRSSRPLSLSVREELFLAQYWLKGGYRFNRFQRGSHSAGDAYQRVFGRDRHMSRNTARSAGGRLARRPWIDAAWRYLIRLTHTPGFQSEGYRLQYPDDIRSAGAAWQALLFFLDCEFSSTWTPEVVSAAANARTIEQFRDALESVGVNLPRALEYCRKNHRLTVIR